MKFDMHLAIVAATPVAEGAHKRRHVKHDRIEIGFQDTAPNCSSRIFRCDLRLAPSDNTNRKKNIEREVTLAETRLR